MGRLSTIICWVLVLLFIAGFVWLIVWLATRQRWHIKVSVESASLTRFDLDRNNTLQYNLTLDISVRNANRATIYYNKLEARALYDGKEFGVAPLPPFTQNKKTTTMVYPWFNGRAQDPGSSVVARFRRERREGSFSIDVKLYGDITIKWETSDEFGTRTNTKGYAPQVDCLLKLSLVSNGGSTPGFSRTACTVNL